VVCLRALWVHNSIYYTTASLCDRRAEKGLAQAREQAEGRGIRVGCHEVTNCSLVDWAKVGREGPIDAGVGEAKV